MTPDVPTEDHAPYSGRGWFSVLHPVEATVFDRGRMHIGVLIQETTQALVDGFNDIQTATTRYIHHAASRTVTPAEAVDLESQPANHANRQQDMDSVTESNTTPGYTVHNDTNPFALEADNPNDAVQLATLRDYHSDVTALAHSKRSWTWVVRLTVVLLLLIMAPGLILGVVTRQVAWGIAISGTFAPAVVFFGGLYYHHNR